ncbi:MFS transporter [Chelatococcus reniformis]|uniref:MFS transporter n=2 Tax=Chelatococcus reniformis TaxID=1494448 RepID=A0A916X9C3_9HYPH|nr:MFS transporter [Chelatococcus reniformis]
MNVPLPSSAAQLPPPVQLTQREIHAILFGVVLAMLLAALDQTIVATALATIGKDLGDVEHLPWVVTIYLLSSTVVTPLYGKASDIWGRRLAMLVAIATFVAGSVACALAPSIYALIVARALQGLGGGGLISLAQTILGDILPPRERSRYQAHVASVFALSSLVGPVLGGLISQHLHWSVIFWINLPLGGLAFWMANSLLRRLPRHERPHKLDFAGAGLLVAATVSLLLALSWGGTRYAWISPEVFGTFAVSAALWGLFALRQRRAAEPLIPTEVLANRVVMFGTLAACFGMGTFVGLSIYAPLYFELVMHLSASDSGVALIPLMIGTVAGATISGRFMMYVRRYKRVALVGLSLGILAQLALAVWPSGLPFWQVEVLLAASSMGLGTLLPVSTISIQNAVKVHQLGTATATMNFFRQLGAAVIVAVFGAILLGGSALVGVPVSSLETFSSPAAGGDLAPVFRWIFAAAALGLAIALTFLAFMEERPLRTTVADPVTPKAT